MKLSISRPSTLSAMLLAAIIAPTMSPASGVDFPTTCAPDADVAIEQGLTHLHNMMYIAAEAAFATAAEADPSCAMVEWGIAMANFHPLWPGGPTAEETARGTAAAERLLVMTPGNDLEKAFAEAAAAFYAPGHDGYRARIAAWAAAQENAFAENPDSIDAAAFAALGRMATAPRGPSGIDVNSAVGDLLDSLHEKAPNHPGVIHYAIHAYDNPPLKERGLPYAEIYETTAPDAAHALHMPAHIFTRTGDWAKSIDLNRRSAEAALEASGDVIQNHYAHAVDYMVYGYLQLGEHEEAEELVEELLAIDNHQVGFGGAYALAASPVRVLLEQEKWADAAALSSGMHPAIPWDNFPQTVAMRWFAKGLGAARSGDVAAAHTAVEELQSLRGRMLESGGDYWASLTEAQILSIEAWVELAEGNDALAVTHQTKAADMEDRIGKSPVTPGHVLPARELLGDMLLEVNQPGAAEEAYRATLAHSPNRARSMARLSD